MSLDFVVPTFVFTTFFPFDNAKLLTFSVCAHSFCIFLLNFALFLTYINLCVRTHRKKRHFLAFLSHFKPNTKKDA